MEVFCQNISCLPDYKQVYIKTQETLTEEERQKQNSLNELINLSKSKVDKSLMIKSTNGEILLKKSFDFLFQIKL